MRYTKVRHLFVGDFQDRRQSGSDVMLELNQPFFAALFAGTIPDREKDFIKWFEDRSKMLEAGRLSAAEFGTR